VSTTLTGKAYAGKFLATFLEGGFNSGVRKISRGGSEELIPSRKELFKHHG